MAIIKEKKKADSLDPGIMILYGVPKVGKTSLLAELDDNLILDLEEGTAMLDDVYKETITDMSTFKKTLEELYNHKKTTGEYMYKYGTIDTVDILEEWCEREAVKTYKQTTMGKSFSGSNILELPQGAGYYHLRNEVLRWIGIARQCFKHLIIVTHIKDKMLTGKPGEEVSAKDISLTGKLASIVCAKSDAIGYLYRSLDGKLMISFQTSEVLTAGSRCEHLKGQKFEADWSKIFIDNK